MSNSKVKELAVSRLEKAYWSLLDECATFEAMAERAFRMSYILNLKAFLDFAVLYNANDTAKEDFFEVWQVILGLEELGINWFEQVYAWAVSRDASFNMDSFSDWAVEFSDYEDKFFVLKTVKEAAKKRKEKLNKKDA